MTTAPPPHPAPSRALVLGGGGAVGNAWLIGVVAGLLDGGLDVTDADLVVGTSAGATAAVQLLCASPRDQYAAILGAAVPARAGTAPARTQAQHLDRTGAVIAASHDAADMRRRMGALLAEGTEPGASDRWRATVAARLPQPEWPPQRLLLTAVDARTGEPVALERSSGVDLVDAVAASTAGGFAYRIGDRDLIDGGYRSNADNADLAAGCSRVLVLSPFGGRTRFPSSWRMSLADQVEALRDAGASVEVVASDDEARHAFGDSMLDLAARAPSARAGHDQGLREVPRLTALWRSL